jgi:predicted ATPase/DNA-binding XRE family transcriptional regulator
VASGRVYGEGVPSPGWAQSPCYCVPSGVPVSVFPRRSATPETSDATFGALLRQYRKVAGLTQEALAERAGLSADGIQKLERGVTHPYRDTAERLIVALLLAPEDEVRFRAAVQPVWRHRTPRPPTSSGGTTHPNNLPVPVNSFVGREQDLVEVKARLGAARLLTLTGVGGCGKTRLAIEVGRAVMEGYPDGVWLVELGALIDPALVPYRVGVVLGGSENLERHSPLVQASTVQALASTLRNRHVLLVLDNCEHLLAACAELVDHMLRACADLQVLATSREPIGIDGEVLWRVPSLALPDPKRAAAAAELGQNPAVKLFVERASAAQPDFTLSARNAAAVAQICRRLDGLPLALELAAARVEALAPEQMLMRLDQSLRLLSGGNRAGLPRQQTLVATLDWSYRLLSKPECRLFEQLAVFAGGWTLEAAEACCAAGAVSADDVLGLLVRLVRNSLIVVVEEPNGSKRYRLLETVREYARQKLAARGKSEATAVQGRHAVFYSTLANQMNPEAQRATGYADAQAVLAVLERFDAESDNLRAALGWWLSVGHPHEGLELAVALGNFWEWSAVHAEGQRWLEAMLDLADSTLEFPVRTETAALTVPAMMRARALQWIGILACRQGDYARARDAHDASVALLRELDDAVLLCDTQSLLGLDMWLAGDATQATVVLEDVLSRSRTMGNLACIAVSLRNLGMIARSQAQYERAATLFSESVKHAQSFGWDRAYAVARGASGGGRVAYLQGDFQRAKALFQDTLRLIHEAGLAGHALTDCLDWVAAAEAAEGRPTRAVRLFGAADAHWRASGAIRYAPDRPAYECDLAAARAALDEAAFETAWAEGAQMNAEQAIAYALT